MLLLHPRSLVHDANALLRCDDSRNATAQKPPDSKRQSPPNTIVGTLNS
jgi:hypothetical protein